MVDKLFDESLEFFKKPIAEKAVPDSTWEGTKNRGYDALFGAGKSGDNANKRGNLNEGMQFSNWKSDYSLDQGLPAYWQERKDFISHFAFECSRVVARLLTLFAKGLDLPADSFTQFHKPGFLSGTALRTQYYPPLNNFPDLSPDDSRNRSHSDFSTMAILWQKKYPGLQVLRPQAVKAELKAIADPTWKLNGLVEETAGWIDVPMKEDCILMNVGNVLEYWSGGRFRANIHRVVCPKEMDIGRQTIVFFAHPKFDTVMEDMTKKGMELNTDRFTAEEHMHLALGGDYGDRWTDKEMVGVVGVTTRNLGVAVA